MSNCLKNLTIRCGAGHKPCDPSQPPATLADIAGCYKKHWLKLVKSETSGYSRHSLPKAIVMAGMAHRFPSEKYTKHPHQYRLSREALRKASQALRKKSKELGSAEDFNALHDKVRAIFSEIPGVGELAAYDAAVRIGSCLKKKPTEVYLHAGTRTGAIAYFGRQAKEPYKDKLPTTVFPEFKGLEADSIESLLCICKQCIKKRTRKP